jgi:ATP-dependent Clp protease ATP-binding subunit ClpC
MMKRELLFFERDVFYEYKEQKKNDGYSIISISNCLKDINNDYFSDFDYTSQIVDISALGSGYNEIQLIGEQIINKFIETETIFIADSRLKEKLQYELRYCFENFNDIELSVNALDNTNKSGKTITSKHKKIIDLTENELEKFLRKFKEQLYGHDKFKDDFTELVLNFRVFNKLEEHKILSLFLLGESGVGKTEVARILHKCLGGKKKLAKVNFGNYSSEFSLSSLIGSARGYIGSDDGEIFIRVRDADVGVILIDEFEKSNATLFNYFLDVLESGKIINSLADEIDLNGFIIVFTSNISKEDFTNKISPELRSRFDYKGKFTLLYEEDKRKFVEFRVKSIIRKYNELESENKIEESEYEYFLSNVDVNKFNNMRDLNKKIKKIFVEYVSRKDLVINKPNSFYKKIQQKFRHLRSRQSGID